MSDLQKLNASKRDTRGKCPARRMRAAGLVPGIFYKKHGESVSLEINAKELRRVYNIVGRTTVFNVSINADGKTIESPAIFWDIDYYPTKNLFQHVDILGVDLDTPISIKVPLVFVGVSKGSKAGGKVEAYREIIEISAKPLDLPQKINVDITNLDINQTLMVSDLKLPEGVKAIFDKSFAIISVVLGGVSDKDEEED